MKRKLMLGMFLAGTLLTGCIDVRNAREPVEMTPAPIVVERDKELEQEEEGKEAGQESQEAEPESLSLEQEDTRVPTKVKGIYVSAYVAGTPSMMDNLIAELNRTEANALVIDLKDDFGRVTCEMDAPMVTELGSVKTYIPDIQGLMAKLKEHDIYVIARIPAFRDAWLGEHRPEWCIQKGDGTVFRDRDGNAWVNPYKQEAWDYLVEIGREAGKLGFDEIQFDYVRFCTERGMKEAVFDEADVAGRSNTDIICEFVAYAYEKLKAEGLFVSADVFGAIINSGVDADAVGQIYGEMAKHLDYISPMIYPSHYGDGNYGIDHPDMHPYETIMAALSESRKELYFAGQDGSRIAQVRPWLQDFTASWLANYIPYGGPEVRAQIQAVYDSGYDEWLLWDASCKYAWDGLLTPEEAAREAEAVAQSRAALPETTYAPETETAAEAGDVTGAGDAAGVERVPGAGDGAEADASGAETASENGAAGGAEAGGQTGAGAGSPVPAASESGKRPPVITPETGAQGILVPGTGV